MNWEAIGAVGEVLGAVAVVITLVYLARQLRENTKSIRLQSVESTYKDWNEILKDMQNIDGVGLAYKKALKGEALSWVVVSLQFATICPELMSDFDQKVELPLYR